MASGALDAGFTERPDPGGATRTKGNGPAHLGEQSRVFGKWVDRDLNPGPTD